MNKENRISKALDPLWASFIEKVDIDILNLRITFDLVLYFSDNAIQRHKLVFDNVSSYFFVNGEGDARYNTEKWDNAELSEIYYFERSQDHILHKNDKEGTPNYVSNPNFHLEIWGAAFMIEAKTITVDGIQYEVS